MSAKKKYEYHEGDKARKHFDVGMRALFQVPKDAIATKKARTKRANTKSKSSERDVSRDSGEVLETS